MGILGFPVLMDGGSITAPNLAIWTENGWVVENEGVPPDIEVEQDPSRGDCRTDPQLEKAIQVSDGGTEEESIDHLEASTLPLRAK